jgi:hypothetical protein
LGEEERERERKERERERERFLFPTGSSFRRQDDVVKRPEGFTMC